MIYKVLRGTQKKEQVIFWVVRKEVMERVLIREGFPNGVGFEPSF